MQLDIHIYSFVIINLVPIEIKFIQKKIHVCKIYFEVFLEQFDT